MKYNILTIILCTFIPLIVFRGKINIKKFKIKVWIKENRYEIALYVILAIGMLVRTLSIDKIPYGIGRR